MSPGISSILSYCRGRRLKITCRASWIASFSCSLLSRSVARLALGFLRISCWQSSSLKFTPARLCTRPSWISQAILVRSSVTAAPDSLTYKRYRDWYLLSVFSISAVALIRASMSSHMNLALAPPRMVTPMRWKSCSACQTSGLPETSMIRSTRSRLSSMR